MPIVLLFVALSCTQQNIEVLPTQSSGTVYFSSGSTSPVARASQKFERSTQELAAEFSCFNTLKYQAVGENENATPSELEHLLIEEFSTLFYPLISQKTSEAIDFPVESVPDIRNWFGYLLSDEQESELTNLNYFNPKIDNA